MYMEHLNKRIIKLENNCETPSMETNSEYFPSNSGSNNTEEYFVFDSDFSLNPEINNSMISNQINEIFLRACQRLVTQTGSIQRVFTYYDHKIALQIQDGELPIQECQDLSYQRNGYSLPGVPLYHARYYEKVYGEIKRTEP